MRTIFLVMDSLNRHFLDCYGGGGKSITPNLDRLAGRGVVFENHWCGSMPCMPARREMMTGRLNFLETPWSPIMPWDKCLPDILRKKNVYSHMITDHYHYFHSGGEAYHDLFDSWEFERGQEGDTWKPLVTDPQVPEGRGRGMDRMPYWRNSVFKDPEDDLSYPTPRCFERACDFIDINKEADNWHLHLEVFDPHEPFDCPKKYRDLYDDKWDKYWYSWPEYSKLSPEDDAEAVAHIRKSYAGTLTMADYWLGKFLDKMDECDMWKDTLLVLTTDHGHLLGEHGYWAKNYQLDYRELANIPMIVCAPGQAAGRRKAMTATMDLMPTLVDYHGAELPVNVHGHSFRKTIEDDTCLRTETIFGYFGKDVNYTDGRHTYCRQPLKGSKIKHHNGFARGFHGFFNEEVMKDFEAGIFLPSQGRIPCWRFEEDSVFHADAVDYNEIFDLENDPGQLCAVLDDALETKLVGRLRALLEKYEAPECQYTRLGL